MRTCAMVCLVLCVCLFGAGKAPAEHKEKKETVYRAITGSDGVQHVEVLGGRYFFVPNRIVVTVNVPVELNVRKEPGIVPHNIVIKAPEAGINVNVTLSDKPTAIRFTPSKVGSYPFYCDKKLLFLPSHREEGMEGTLEVVE